MNEAAYGMTVSPRFESNPANVLYVTDPSGTSTMREVSLFKDTKFPSEVACLDPMYSLKSDRDVQNWKQEPKDFTFILLMNKSSGIDSRAVHP